MLEGCEDRLSVLPVPACGWSDLGTPDRVAQCVGQMARGATTPLGPGVVTPNLAQVSLRRTAT